MSIAVSFDTKQFETRLDLASREMRNASRRSIDRAARLARNESVKELALDIGVKVRDFRDSVPLVKASTQADLSASFKISKKRILIALTGSNLPARFGGGLQASTFRKTGGGSAALNVAKAFTIRVNGVDIVMVRRGKGRGAIKAIYAENPVAGFSQEDAAPRKVWLQTASRALAASLPSEIQAALNGQSLSTSTDGGA